MLAPFTSLLRPKSNAMKNTHKSCLSTPIAGQPAYTWMLQSTLLKMTTSGSETTDSAAPWRKLREGRVRESLCCTSNDPLDTSKERKKLLGEKGIK